MKFHIRFADQVVGFFVLVAMISLLLIVIFMGINQRWFAKDYYFITKFQSGNGLSVGMPIKLKGFKIGTIDEIALNKDNTVEARFHIFDTYYGKITRDSVLELTVSPIGIGGSGMQFYPGKSRELIPDNSYIPSLDFEEGQMLVAKGLVDKPPADDTIVKIINQIGPLLDNSNETLISLNSVLKTVDDSLNGKSEGPAGDIVGRLSLLTKQLNTMMEDASGQINSILSDTSGITSNIEATTSQLTDTTGLVTKLLDPKGSIAKLLDDNLELYSQITGILSSVELTTTELNTFTRYINSSRPQISGLLESSREALQKGKDVLEALSNNPLLRGGISSGKEQPTTFKGYREEDF